jgi:hypothetical protein
MLAWIELLPSFKPLEGLLLPSYISYCHVLKTCPNSINEIKNKEMKKYQTNMRIIIFYIKLTKPTININK